MFAVEIAFPDDEGTSESVLVRRPFFLVGGRDNAHLVIEDLQTLPFDVIISRGLGRTFSWHAKEREESSELLHASGGASSAARVQGTCNGRAIIELGNVALTITSVDIDLSMREGEPPDQAGMRALRIAGARSSPEYPALKVEVPFPSILSFASDQTIYCGRGRDCNFRLDVPEISASHARIGFEAGRFWIEDVGSTNGTFVDSQQVAGRVPFTPSSRVALARSLVVKGIVSPFDIGDIPMPNPAPELSPLALEYPALIARSSACRPAKLVVNPDASLKIGRDPSNDMWLGAPHVSRIHCEVLNLNGSIRIVDRSTNGTTVDGKVLRFGEYIDSGRDEKVIDFGNGIVVALCFSPQQEREFLSSGPALDEARPSGGDFAQGGSAGRARGVAARSRTEYTGELSAMALRFEASARQHGTPIFDKGGSSGGGRALVRSMDDEDSILEHSNERVRSEMTLRASERNADSKSEPDNSNVKRASRGSSLPYRVFRWRFSRMRRGTGTVVRAGLSQRKSLILLAGLSLLFIVFLLVSLLRGVW
jgi:pSer/pThr/pTyr-binding forkhead associated (FHA) protein